MSNEIIAYDVFGDLREALENLDDAQADGEAVAIAVEQLGTAIDAAVAVLGTPAPPVPERIAEHNRLVNEVNAAIGCYNRAVHALAAVGAWCQFCGMTIEDGADAVPTAEIPEEGIQLWAHAGCHARVTAAQSAPSVDAFLAAEQAERSGS